MPYNSIRSARRPALGARLARLYVRSVSRSTAFSSAQALPSRSSAGGCPPLFGPFAGTTAQSDSSAAYTWGVRHAPSPTGLPLGGRASPRSPGSRAESFLTCTSSSTAPGPVAARAGAAAAVAFPSSQQGRPPRRVISRLHSPARQCLCQRFARDVATAGA